MAFPQERRPVIAIGGIMHESDTFNPRPNRAFIRPSADDSDSASPRDQPGTATPGWRP